MNKNNNFDELQKRIDKFKERTGITKKILPKEKNIYTDLALNFFITVGLGAFIGYSIDSWLNLKPIFFLICLLIGIISGVVKIYFLTK
ncbi:MAG: AtpZ/AtpI family protein [Alphaproteobacteria bacterium]|nr:AtpZ/AtpI family protein [Alphaproteobacteria bacterium]OJV13529.1 MAG: hypothetical protein BGO27_04915 [Alphaproteobacteria bacterium 33-17]